jgi:ribonuclease BN (tRNA processing enzyme)
MGKKKNDKIRISFVGTNATEVTGSMTLVEYPTSDGGTKKILLEIGLNQTNNIKNDYEVNSRKFKFKPRELDFVIINHLHGDHSLLSGRLFKEGCSCPVIMPKGSFGFMTHMIRISSPRPNDTVKSPLKITGEARGFWFNEASFPIKIYGADGKELGTAIASAKSDWMTEEFVPFEATLTFEAPKSGKGTLVLQKDNPSGLPKNDDSLKVPVKFESGN